MRASNNDADIHARPTRSQRYSTAGLAALAAIFFGAGVATVYAFLFPVLISDIVSITDQPSLRTNAKDSLDPQEAPSNSQTASDDLGPLDAVSPSSSVADNLGLSDSAQVTASMFYQVTTTSILAISDSVTSGTPALDSLDVQDRIGLRTAVREAISLADSAARMFVLYITDSLAIADGITTQGEQAEVDEEDDRDTGGVGGGPDRAVYDQSYFEDKPQSRLVATSVDLVDSQDRVITRVLSGQSIDLSIAMRNHQRLSQDFTLFVQITDKDGVAIEIIQVSGVIKDGVAIKVKVPLTALSPGPYSVGIVICDDNSSPTIIAESISKGLVIG